MELLYNMELCGDELLMFLILIIDKLPVGVVSPLVVQCVAYLNHQECLDEPGLFRIPGDMSIMKQYRVLFARGKKYIFCIIDYHYIATHTHTQLE